MENDIEQFILTADSKALATYSESNLNVIPVSSLKIKDGKIWLINYFMDKTMDNIVKNKKVALVCWRKMMGYQIKGDASYHSDGPEFDEAVLWIKDMLPDRIVKGLLIITPREIYDVSPGKNTKEKFLLEQESKSE